MNKIGGMQTGLHGAMKPAITHDKQCWQVKYLIALHQASIITGIDPGQTIDRQRQPGQLTPGPATTGTTGAGKDDQRGAGPIQQVAIGIKIGQVHFCHYTDHSDVILMALGEWFFMRRFLRHPSEMPVELVLRRQAFVPKQRLNNISLGGVACNSSRGFRRGSAVELRIPLLGDQARYPGLVAWCRKLADGYLVGVAFIDEDTLFRARMVEQVCQIEHYRLLREQQLGECVPIESAAREWIAQHASEFSHASLR